MKTIASECTRVHIYVGKGAAEVMKKRICALAVVTVALCACLLALAGCGSSDQKDLIGEWKVQGTNVTVVYDDKQFKTYGTTFDYTIDTNAKTITTTNGSFTGLANYSYSDDKQTLTLNEDDGNGGTKTTVFDKVSSNGDAEPSVDGVAESAAEDTGN